MAKAKARFLQTPPGATVAAAGRPGTARSGHRRWRRRLCGLAGGVLLLLAGTLGYSALLVDRFQHAIYHPLPSPVALRIPGPLPATAPPVRSPIPATAPPILRPTAARVPVALTTATRERALPTSLPTAPAVPTLTPLRPPVVPTETPASGRINILVLGTDQRPDDLSARSDTLIILSIDPLWKTAGILSVPRDLQVRIPGYGLQKVNAAYFFGQYDNLPGGGPGLALTTMSQYFDILLPYYVAINFTGFQTVIDMLGGIDVYVPAAIDDPLYPGPNNSTVPIHFDAGCQHLDGVRALQYARTRHADSDFGRNRRQQQVIQAVRARVLQLDMVPHYAALLGQLGDALATNIPPAQQLDFAQLLSQIPTPNLYTAQIDNTLVSEVPGTSNLALNWDAATPLLDWFFGRGAYAGQKPGGVLPPLAGTPTSQPNAAALATGTCP